MEGVMNINISRLAFIVLIGFVSGCAAKMEVKNASLAYPVYQGEAEDKAVDLLMEPYETLGLLLTPAIRKGDITVIQGIFPDILFGEYYPGRIRWNGWVGQEDGKEFFAQILLSTIDYSGYFLETIVIDGKPEKKARITLLASLVDFAYDLSGKEFPIETHKFLNDDDNRKKIILKSGTKIGDMETIPTADFMAMLAGWNQYQTPKGVILSPLGEKEIKLIASINPQYTSYEKFIGITKGSISLDYIGTSVNVALEILKANNGSVPSTGWDYNSELPSRRNMAMIMEYVSAMRIALVRELNSQNIQRIKGDEKCQISQKSD